MTDSERAMMVYHLGFVEKVLGFFLHEDWMRADRNFLQNQIGSLQNLSTEMSDYYQRGRTDAVAYCFQRPRREIRREIWRRYGPYGEHVQYLIVDN
ncbi:hypothetical protein [Salinicola rhizosphaerae]|uniref:Uncharacterized protein n=1 Tax=Salinicola rhizosphaerae TaxID=1443141 RepID=A0ABQ3EDF5_9GAMM|nr:hypothetical protein [Salinicola rhizosphaerae]GHB34516.1 hypothetical protein GCM10009038_37020 [Salinicola rhizosphaerae]